MVYKENIFLKIVTYGPLVFIPLLIGIILLISIQLFNDSFKDNLKKTEENLYYIEKKALQNRVDGISKLITYKKSIIKQQLTSRVQGRVDLAYDIASEIYTQNADKKSPQQIKEMIINALQGLLWNEGESFIWIIDYNGVLRLAPEYLKSSLNSSIINTQDSTGRYVIKEEIALAKDGGGLLWDTFTKFNDPTKKQYEQVAYVRPFGSFNWYFGSAEYLDTATRSTDKELIDTIKQLDYLKDRYIFLISQQGEILINRSIKKLDNPSDSSTKSGVVKNILDRLKDDESASISYEWLNPINQKMEQKYSFVQRVPNTNWIVGSGFYLSSIEDKLSLEKINLYAIFYQKSKNIILLSIFLILISLLLSYYISRKLKRSFHKYEENINNKNSQLKQLNDTLEAKVQERTHALQEMKDSLEILATTDALTNIHNRYSLMKILSFEITRAHRYKTPLSLIMYDIDHFKKVNDKHGHIVGDQVLKSLSDIVQSSLREVDIVGRYGGEEFLIILPNTTLKEGEKYAERLRVKIQNNEFATVGNITISIGLTALEKGEAQDTIFERTDELLYKSKNSGRNRVSF